jgi:tyrosyl-tRNA synthetase
MRAININKITQAGIRFKMLVADWHAMANNKLGGDLDKIKTVGQYFIEVWRACGMDLSKIDFVWASDLVKDPKYWQLVVQVGRTNALRRFIRTAEIMGREESLDKLTGAMIIYSCMQVADIFFLGAKICQLGMDQRKVNMLAREIGPQLGYWKPVVVSHHMLMGLKPPAVEARHSVSLKNKLQKTIEIKMSKSLPDSAIFMTDTLDDIKRKINKAYCPEGQIENNPVLEYYKYILFQSLERLGLDYILVERPLKYGGPVVLHSYANLEELYLKKEIHPQDIKNTAIELLDRLIDPVREHFQKNSYARSLLEKVRSYQITR